LNSSLAYSNDELWPYTKGMLFNPWFPFVGVESLTTFWFVWHNFYPDMLESQSRALKTHRIA